MESLSQKLEHDPFLGAPIPGQSLTATPGVMPYEKPPMSTNVNQSFLALKAGLYTPKTQRGIGEMTLAGLSCETIASSMVMMAFTQGMFNPDVAEIIKPFLALEIFKIAKNQGVKDVILENKPMETDENLAEFTQSLHDLKEDVAPDNMYDIEFTPEEKNIIGNTPGKYSSENPDDIGNMEEIQKQFEMDLPPETNQPEEGFIDKPKESA